MDQDMQQYLDKAEVLIEALTYIQRFKSCKFTSLFSPVTTDKLIPSVLF